MNFYVNELIVDCETGKELRVLWISEDNKYIFVIDTKESNAFPLFRKVEEIKDGIIEGGLLKKLSDSPPKTDGIVSDKAIADKDIAWNIIKDIVNREPDIYFDNPRGKLINEVMQKHKISKPSVYKYLRKYWQRGKVPNALLPDFSNCGAKGQSKQNKNKNGRPGKYKELVSKVVITEDIKKIFRYILQKYYLNQKKNQLPYAYKMMLREFYLKDTYYENGEEKVILMDTEEIPSINQLRYFLKSEYSPKQITIPRIGKTKYEQLYREMMGNSTSESFGPGSRFQIDATIADVYLISEYNADWIIGRPVVYLVVDVFSRLIAGMYVGLEGPSWIGAMMAIANTSSDKQIYCKEYGIKITKEQWPCEHLPQKLLADRGEFEGYNVERLTNAFNLVPENAAPYRPDWKGIVEKYFDVIQRRVKPLLPGYIEKDFRERGAKDYRLDAKLTLKEFTKIMIAEIIYHNNHHLIKDYPRNKDMIADEVMPIPIQLWNWGIKKSSGKLTYYPPEQIKLNLLPHDIATVTEKGIKYKKMHYSCDKAMKESWFSAARIKGTWNVDIAYDPRNMSIIYLISNNGMSFEVCRLLDYEEKYMGMAEVDINYLHEYEDLQQRKYQHQEITEEINLINQIEDTVSSAIQRAEDLQSKDLSNNERVKSINEHRAEEKERLREKEQFNLEADNLKFQQDIVIKNEKPSESEFKRKSIKELLQQKSIGDKIHG
jgi:hypothetical protein